MVTEVRSLGPEGFEEIYPLLARLPNRTMSKQDWRWLLFEYPWGAGRQRGWALYADGKAVGFMGAVFSERPLAGRVEKFCNPSSWSVLEPYRYAATLLLRPMLALHDHTILSLWLSAAACKVFRRLGLRPLESEQLVLPPIPRPAEILRALRGSFTLDAAQIRAELGPAERKLHEDMWRATCTCAAAHGSAILSRRRRANGASRTPTCSTSATASSSGSTASSLRRRSPAQWASPGLPLQSTGASSSDGCRRSPGA
jgi:hypothetical protein